MADGDVYILLSFIREMLASSLDALACSRHSNIKILPVGLSVLRGAVWLAFLSEFSEKERGSEDPATVDQPAGSIHISCG